MGRPCKPGVSWAQIRIEWLAGASAGELGRRHDVSKQAISARIQREHWERGYPPSLVVLPKHAGASTNKPLVTLDKPDPTALPTIEPDDWLSAARGTHSAMQMAAPVSKSEQMVAAIGKRTPEVLAAILEHVEAGLPKRLAAEATGISGGMLAKWEDDDPGVADLVSQAAARSVARKVGRIEEAGERGDAATDRWMLERHPASREEFGGQARANQAPVVAVQINVTRGDDTPPIIGEGIRPRAEVIENDGSGGT